jgi:hypothetical protein
MSERAASVRLQLKSGGFLSGLHGVTEAVKSAGKAMGRALSSAGREGFKSAKDSLSGIASEAKSAAKWGLTLGGALSLGGAAKEAMGLADSYKSLAFAVRAGTGAVVDYKSLQADVEDAARNTARGNEEMAATLSGVFADTGDIEFAKLALSAIGREATNTGKSTDALAGIAGHLYEKFGVRNNISSALAEMVSFANQGGLSVEDFGEKLGMLGASAKVAGYTGEAGLRRIVAMVNTADDSLGNAKQKIGAVTGLLDELGDPTKVKAIEKALGLQGKLVGKDKRVRSDALEQILVKTGGDQQKLANLFSGPIGKLVATFGEIYSSGAKGGDKEAGLRTFRDAMEKAGKAASGEAESKEELVKRLQDPKAQLTLAMNEMTSAMSKPEMLSAMKQLAHLAPKLASGMMRLVKFAVDNPWTTGAAYVGGRVAGATMSRMAVELGQQGLKAAGASLAKMFAEQVAADGAWEAAGKLFGVAGGAAAAFMVGKAIIDAMASADEAKNAKAESVAAVGSAVAASGTKEQRTAYLARAKQELERVKTEGPSVGEKVFGTIESVTGSTSILERSGRQKMELESTVAALERSLNTDSVGQATRNTIESFQRMAEAADRATKSLGGVKPTGSNGLPPPAPTKEGY